MLLSPNLCVNYELNLLSKKFLVSNYSYPSHQQSFFNAFPPLIEKNTNENLIGFRTIGAVCKSPNNIHLTDEVYSDTGRIQFTWTLERESTGGQTVNVPVYLYANRARLLFRFEFVPEFGRSLLNERGVALICNIFLS